MKRVLITGAAGFIGAHLVKYILINTDWEIVCLDRFDTSGNINRISEMMFGEVRTFEAKRVKVIYHDLKAAINEHTAKALGVFDYIVHLAAASHVDRSIKDPMSFIMDNVVGTTNLLLWARNVGLKKKWGHLKRGTVVPKGYDGIFLNFSTDESVGPAPVGYKHTENEPHKPSNPYAASKAGQEDIGYAFHITYKLPVITTRTMNNFGQMQAPEKLVPRTIRSILEGTPMPIFAKLNNGILEAVGSRIWIHATNTASAIRFILEHGYAGEYYNVIGFDELTNLEIAEKISTIIGKPLIPHFVDVDKVRPGHDLRYSLDGAKLRNMGWKPEIDFDTALQETVAWTLEHPEWQ